MSAVTEAQVEDYLAQLCQREGRPAPTVTWVDGGGSQIRTGRRNQLQLDRRILECRDDAQFTAAHELGHIALGHTTGRRNGRMIGVYVGTLILAMAAAVWLAVTFLSDAWIAVALVLGAMAWLPLQRQLSLRIKQPMEHAADLYAARAGAPLTPELVQRYEAERTPTSRFLSYVFPLHPSWTERAAVTNAAFPPPEDAR